MKKKGLWVTVFGAYGYIYLFFLVLSLCLFIGRVFVLLSYQGFLLGPALLDSLYFWYPRLIVVQTIFCVIAIIGVITGLATDLRKAEDHDEQE